MALYDRIRECFKQYLAHLVLLYVELVTIVFSLCFIFSYRQLSEFKTTGISVANVSLLSEVVIGNHQQY